MRNSRRTNLERATTKIMFSGPAGRWMGWAFLVGMALVLRTQSAQAAGYDFRLLEFEVTGQNAFFDDFEDGSRNNLPTLFFDDLLSSVTTESGGSLNFTDADGFQTDDFFGTPVIRDLIFFQKNFSDGAGDFEITTTLAPITPTDTYQSLILALNPLDPVGTPTIGFGIDWSSDQIGLASPCGSGFQAWAFDAGSGAGYLGCDSIDPAAVTGNIVQKIVVDNAGNTVTLLYSIDGGATFTAMSDFDVPVGSITDFPEETFFGRADSRFYISGNGLPEPHTLALLALGMMGLACWRRAT